MAERLYFSQLAEQFGIEGGTMPGGTGGHGGPGGPGGPVKAVTHPNVWRKEGGTRLLAYLREKYQPGDVFEYDGHGDCWMMLAIMYTLRDCQLCTYIGAFDKDLPITAYSTGAAPVPGQPCTFTVEEQGDNILLTVHLDPDKGPFDMPFAEIVAPELPAGKNIYVHLDGRHLLFTFPLSLTYGADCRSIIMDYDGECFCSVSNTPDLEVGDLVENPFSR